MTMTGCILAGKKFPWASAAQRFAAEEMRKEKKKNPNPQNFPNPNFF